MRKRRQPVAATPSQGALESLLARHYAAQKKYTRRLQEDTSPRERELAHLLYEENRHEYKRIYHQLYGSSAFIEVTEDGR
ncbi:MULTISPECIES: hypothetical protein [unclassified Exiguobacterium]|uniref:hypothetical protein n=1 Tax=unclassified Exiguobacterium TaxID=2644629 RepID=UPI001BE7D570|nr:MULTISPECIES: hypothetical protein [unclassified Exiguobacterium]